MSYRDKPIEERVSALETELSAVEARIGPARWAETLKELRGSGDSGWNVHRDGSSCMCGNGQGGAVRVDPDGTQTATEMHHGPARTPESAP